MCAHRRPGHRIGTGGYAARLLYRETERVKNIMKCGTQMALGVGAGYLLGRTRKMRLAIGLGAAAATGGFGGVTSKLLKRGTDLAGANGMLGKVTPELTEVTDMVRGELVEVGKAAAVAALRGQLNRVSDRLHEQAESLRTGRENGEEEADEDAAEPEDRADRPRRRRRAADTDEPEDRAEADDAEDFDDAEESDDSEKSNDSERMPSRSRSRVSSAAGRTTSRARASAGGSPVRRTRR
jgi:hypothetical protein